MNALLTMMTMSLPMNGPLPTARQLRWHQMEQYVLVHFTPTTFENKEWGYGDADPKIFNPSAFDADQIVEAVRSGGFRGLVLVAKHHDGFCLWPSATTPYNISRSPWKDGKGDMVGEFAEACRRGGLAFGVYCSPWDRNHPEYGQPGYVSVYHAQLRELYTRYGELFMSWHDGANGGDGYYGGAREKRTIDRGRYYDWERAWAMTRALQPNAVIFSDIGPDVRWVGNERGVAAETSWATFDPIPLAGKSAIAPGEIDYRNSEGGTWGGRHWIPAECDVPLRPGWFYHPEQDGQVKTAEQLFDLYLQSVGRGGCLNLGIAPDTRGRLHERDTVVLAEYGRLLRERFGRNLALEGRVDPLLVDGDWFSGAVGPDVTVEWTEPVTARYLRMREDIQHGHRVRRWQWQAWHGERLVGEGRGESLGAGRIVKLPGAVVTRLTVRVSGAPGAGLSEIGVY